MKKLIIIGAGGHGKVVADIAENIGGYGEILFLDDSDSPKNMKYRVVGKTDDFQKYADAEFAVAIGSADARARIQEKLGLAGAKIATLVHPRATVANSAQIGEGSVVMAGAVINPDAKIGIGCIVNTCASVDHDSEVGDFSHVSVGARICGTVRIGDRVWIGAGATVINNVNICDCAFVGAGAAVVSDISEKGTYVGVPARRIK